MPESQDQIQVLLNKIETLLFRQNAFHAEIDALKKEVEILKNKNLTQVLPLENIEKVVIEDTHISIETPQQPSTPISPKPIFTPHAFENISKKADYFNVDKGWEKFIGENLLNKIGIVVLVIGVAIGAKYAIDHQMISPLTRIIMGYIMGFGLMGFALYLKKNYENFSAVLLSGSLSILYIITFMAFSFYKLMPQHIAFGLMVLFTIFTVLAASHYQRQVIALLGLVGAYAVPFLLSNDTGNVLFLYTYVGIINLGILIIAFIKNWNWVNISAFIFTWMIYFSVFESYYYKDHFPLLFGFLLGFFLQFYITLLAYKFFKNERFEVLDIFLLLSNSFIFFAAGYALWNNTAPWKEALGLFSLGNALLHFAVTLAVYKRRFADQNMFYFVMGLVLIFLTITIPVQLDGNWVTILWILEAVLLFWIGRTKKVGFYETLSYPLVFIAFFSLLHDWGMFNISDYSYPVFNLNFASSALFSIALGSILYMNHKVPKDVPVGAIPHPNSFLFSIFGILMLLSLYFTFRFEISRYWNHLFELSGRTQTGEQTYLYNYHLQSFEALWILNYSIVFFTVLIYINHWYFKLKNLEFLSLVLGTISIFVFLLQGLNELNSLQNAYYQTTSDPHSKSYFWVMIRFISFGIVGACLWIIYRFIIKNTTDSKVVFIFDLILHITVLWILSNELVQNLALTGYKDVHKSGLSILWGLYSFILITFGIWKKKKHLRLGAMLLFGVTLFKLVFYDLSHLETISKTIVFVLLGILLLIISFLYNKYQKFIEEE